MDISNYKEKQEQIQVIAYPPKSRKNKTIMEIFRIFFEKKKKARKFRNLTFLLMSLRYRLSGVLPGISRPTLTNIAFICLLTCTDQ